MRREGEGEGEGEGDFRRAAVFALDWQSAWVGGEREWVWWVGGRVGRYCR